MENTFKMFNKIYKGQYSMACFNKKDINPNEDDNDEYNKNMNINKNYYNFIIENGFYIFILCSYFMMSK